MTRGRYRQLVRCLRLVRERSYRLDPSRTHLLLLADRHGVSVRTIRRDLQALREAGYGYVAWTEVDIPGDVVGMYSRANSTGESNCGKQLEMACK